MRSIESSSPIPRPSNVRAAAARLAAVERWHADDPERVRQARRDLLHAHAAAQVVAAAAILAEPEVVKP